MCEGIVPICYRYSSWEKARLKKKNDVQYRCSKCAMDKYEIGEEKKSRLISWIGTVEIANVELRTVRFLWSRKQKRVAHEVHRYNCCQASRRPGHAQFVPFWSDRLTVQILSSEDVHCCCWYWRVGLPLVASHLSALRNPGHTSSIEGVCRGCLELWCWSAIFFRRRNFGWIRKQIRNRKNFSTWKVNWFHR